MLASAVVPSTAPAATAEGEVVKEINRVRLWHGLQPLRRSPSLHESSSRYARMLMRRDVFAHQARIAVAGRFQWAGENLELHWGWRPKPRWTVRRWMGSAGHRAVILSDDWRWIGVGRSRGDFNARSATIWVAHFGRK
ncbi:MAG TPA: CAP domain-containing protein [Thermoleophilaceae bacterium]|nr:CAP domain-containing protein [Thermoleophilaceae bacterium]